MIASGITVTLYSHSCRSRNHWTFVNISILFESIAGLTNNDFNASHIAAKKFLAPGSLYELLEKPLMRKNIDINFDEQSKAPDKPAPKNRVQKCQSLPYSKP